MPGSSRATPSGARPGGSGWRAALSALALALVAVRPAAASDPGDRSLELSVKAGYVYHFTRFVTWPAESPLARSSELIIGVLDDDPFADALEAAVRGKTVGGRPLAVRRFRSVEDVVPSPVLFVGRGRSADLAGLHKRIRGWPVLTVSDAGGFVCQGGVIGLFLLGTRIRFEVHVGAARAAGLAVSSKLLRLSSAGEGGPAACARGGRAER